MAAGEQAKGGDIAGAQKTFAEAQKNADLVPDAGNRSRARSYIARAQAWSGDITGAKNTANAIQDPFWKCYAESAIAEALAKSGDRLGAQKYFIEAQRTADLIQDASQKLSGQSSIAEAQERAGIANVSNLTRQSTSSTQSPTQTVVTASDWIAKLYDEKTSNDCPLNTDLFLDFAEYLKSLPTSDNPQTVFKTLHETASKMVKAQNVITGMLKQKDKR